jgi:acyl-CoA dehydrogenase
MATETDVARTYVRSVAERYAAGEDVAREAAMAKNAAVCACERVVYDAVQLHGGLGYMRDVEVERHYRDARILAIGGGTTEIMNELIASRLGLDE